MSEIDWWFSWGGAIEFTCWRIAERPASEGDRKGLLPATLG